MKRVQNLFDVAVLVREVDVGHGQHHMAVVVDLRQGEIMPFDLLRGSFERSPKAGNTPSAETSYPDGIVMKTEPLRLSVGSQ